MLLRFEVERRIICHRIKKKIYSTNLSVDCGIFNENETPFPLLRGVDCTLAALALTGELLPRVPVSTLFRRVICVPHTL